MLRILTQTLIGAGFLAGGFFVGTQVAANPLVAVLLGLALVAAAIALADKPNRSAKTEKDAAPMLEAAA